MFCLFVCFNNIIAFSSQLEGVSEPVVLQVFVANDAGRVKPHGFYQACRVTGRNTTACTEVDIEGTTVIEIPLEPSSDMILAYESFFCGGRGDFEGFLLKSQDVFIPPYCICTGWTA